MNFILLLLLFFSTTLTDDIVLSSNINLWILLSMLAYNIIRDRYVSVGSIFTFGFIYIFFKEFLTQVPEHFSTWGVSNVTTGFHVIMNSFTGLMFGYYLRNEVKRERAFINVDYEFMFIKSKRKFFILNVLAVIIIFAGNIFLIIEGFTQGRPNAFKYGLLSNFSYAFAIIIILNFKLYYKQYYGKYSYVKILFYTFPLFVLLLASGARFLLLYGIIALVSDSLYNLTNAKLVKMTLFLLVFGLLSNLLLAARDEGFLNLSNSVLTDSSLKEKTFNERIVANFTDEGLLRNSAMITDYVNRNDNTYGKTISFILYFWVPRDIWPDKPTQLDHWLIRKYTNEYDDSGHSTASGFMGELYMDFGPYLILPILGFIGWLMSSLNFNYYLNRLKFNYISVILNGSVLAWIFFSVRSILTSTFIFLFIYLSAYLINKYFKKWGILN